MKEPEIGDIFMLGNSIIQYIGGDRRYGFNIKWLKGVGVDKGWNADGVENFNGWTIISAPVLKALYLEEE